MRVARLAREHSATPPARPGGGAEAAEACLVITLDKADELEVDAMASTAANLLEDVGRSRSLTR